MMGRRKASRATRLWAALVSALMITALLAALAPNASAAWQQPGFVRSIGGHGEAGVYAWGMEYNPVTNEILVSDYWNYQVRRYDPTTGKELGAFYRPVSVRKGQPYTVSVDPNDGDIYVPEWGDGQAFSGAVGHYDKNGNYLNALDISPPTAYNVWTHVDVQGRLWVADSHFWNNASFPPQIRVFNLAGDEVGDPFTPPQLAAFGTYGSGPGQLGNDVHGLATDWTVVNGVPAVQRLYVADAPNKTVHVFDVHDLSNIQWVTDIGGPGDGPGQFAGDLRGVAVDNTNHWLYVVDAEGSQIEKYDITPGPNFGSFITEWGSQGDGPGQYTDGGREITLDGQGNVWVADFGHNRIFKYTPTGTLLGTYPDPARPAPQGFFSQDRDVAVDPVNGDIWAADSWNNRFEKFSSNGAFIASWGQRNSHPPYGMDYPRGIAVDPATRNVWVADTREHVIRVYDRQGNYLFTIGDGRDSNDPGSFRWPMDIQFYGGKAYVTDYYGRYLKILDATNGNWLGQIGLRTTRSISSTGVAIDPSTGNIYIASWVSDQIYEYSPDGSTLIRQWGGSGTGPGQFDTPWGIDIVNGLIYVDDAKLSRVQVFDLSGNFVGMWGSKGSGPYQYDKPSGISHDSAGRIYIADAGNDRILVYNPAAAPPSGDTTQPTATLASPANNAVLPASTVMMTGSATDNVGVAKVEVAIQDRDTGKWWNATSAIWQTKKVFNLSALVGNTAANVTWKFAFIGVVYGGRYQAQLRTTDTSGNMRMSALPIVSFSLATS